MTSDSVTDKVSTAKTKVFGQPAPIRKLLPAEDETCVESYREVFDAHPDPICITKLSTWRIVLVNREFERASGFSQQDALGRTTVELRLWCNPEEQERCFRLLKVHGRLHNLPMTMQIRDGRKRPYLLSASIVRLNGEPCTMTVARDVSALRKIENELVAARNAAEAASQAKSEFLSSVSHEIRTPMNAIMGMAELLAETDLNKEQRGYLTLMRSNGAALLTLINDVLDVARVERGLMNLEITEFDLGRVVHGVLDTLKVRAKEKGLRVSAKIDCNLAVARLGDQHRLRQILVNLVGNAIKFTAQGSVLVTVAEAEGEMVRFAIEDTGIGIDEAKVDLIFNAFTQGDSSTARQYGGSGLGLAIVKRLVELMGGHVWVTSRIGVGSTFYFTARLLRAPAPLSPLVPATPTTAPLPAPATSGEVPWPLSILVVDDSADNRFLLRAFLRRLAHIEEAENGSDAVEIVKTRRFDLILMDVRMPVMDGIAATRAIRQREKDENLTPVPIIALTASALPDEVEECLAAGCDFHVSKPVSKKILQETIANATARIEKSNVKN